MKGRSRKPYEQSFQSVLEVGKPKEWSLMSVLAGENVSLAHFQNSHKEM